MGRIVQDEGATAPAAGGNAHLAGAAAWLLAIALAFAAVVVWAGSGGAASGAVPPRQDDASLQATATREAELAELSALQTQVAELQTQVAVECAEPTPTVEPTPVPPSPSGQPVSHAGDWTVVVGPAALRSTIEARTAKGTYVELVLTITNDGTASRSFKVHEFVLTDGLDREFRLAMVETSHVDPTAALPFQPGLPRDIRIVFDVPADAGQTFILESSSDPAFRVEVVFQARG